MWEKRHPYLLLSEIQPKTSDLIKTTKIHILIADSQLKTLLSCNTVANTA